MPFGVQGGPATFQTLMDKLLFGLDFGTALAYLDNIYRKGIRQTNNVRELLVAIKTKLKKNRTTADQH